MKLNLSPHTPLGSDGTYKYTRHLMQMNRHSSRAASDPRLGEIRTPLKLKAWTQCLRKHPDRDYCQCILNGIEHGFQIGVNENSTVQSSYRNMQSATEHPDIIEAYLATEGAIGNILGPFSRELAPRVHVNRVGAIPKKHQPGKWRIITHLSAPEGSSINEAIQPEICTLSYITVKEVAWLWEKVH